MSGLSKADVKEVVGEAVAGAVGEIKEFVEVKIDELAVMVKQGFDDVDRRFEQVDKRFDRLEGRMGGLESEMKTAGRVVRSHSADISELKATSHSH